MRRQVVDAARELDRLGMNRGSSGNVSVRTRSGMLITPSGIPPARLGAHHVVAVSADGSFEGRFAPSSEWRFHRDIYGARTLQQIEDSLKQLGEDLGVSVVCFQSNREGELVDELQKAGTDSDGVILNAGAYTHTSVAVRDAVSAIQIPVVEVHLSNPQAREEFRKISL